MNVRPLTPRDAAPMADIHAACFEKSWPALDMSVHVSRDLCFGIGTPLGGFAILRRSDVDAEILTIATAPRCRGRGLARGVLEHAIESCRDLGLRDLFLEVAEDNESAKALYKRLGFTPIGRRPGYYSREDGRVAAITYSLPLDGPARDG